jgi:hypothetical protein
MGEALIEILPNSLGPFVVDDTLTQVPGVTVWCESLQALGTGILRGIKLAIALS